LEEKFHAQQQHPSHGRACVVCLERPRCIRLPCGHEALCAFCAGALQHRREGCPLCRAPFPEYKIGNYGRHTFQVRHTSNTSTVSNEGYQAKDPAIGMVVEGTASASVPITSH